jgi:hypothetical protein
VRAIEVDGRGGTDQNVNFSGPAGGPPTRGNCGANDLLFGGGEHVGNVQVTEGVDVHPGRYVGLRVEVNDKGAKPFGESC